MQKKNSHRSSAVRGNKRPCEEQLKMVDSVINAKVGCIDQYSSHTKSIVNKVEVKGDNPNNEISRERALTLEV